MVAASCCLGCPPWKEYRAGGFQDIPKGINHPLFLYLREEFIPGCTSASNTPGKHRPFISHRLLLEEIPKAFETIETHDPMVMKVIILPNG